MKIPLGHKIAHLLAIANPYYCFKYNCNNREGVDKDMCFNKPSMTNRPESTGPKVKVKGLTIELPRECKQPLLQITLDEENGVPKVFYKGEEIKLNREISFHWETSSEHYTGGLTYVIEHAEPNLIVNRIERRVKGHACD